MENASKFHTARIKDLMAAGSGKQGNDSQQKLDRLREEDVFSVRRTIRDHGGLHGG